VIRFALAAVMLAVPGYPPARLLCSSPAVAVVVAPLVTGSVLAVGATVTVLFGLPFITAAVVLAVISVACGVAWFTNASPRPRREGGPRADAIAAGALVLASAPLAITLWRAPVSHDANVIWWFHARWLLAGGDAAASAMADPLFAYSHSEYPPLAPASVGWVWWLAGSRDLALAQAATAVLSISALCMLGYAVWRTLRGHGHGHGWASTAGCLALFAAVGVTAADPSGASITNGTVDVVWAAAFAAGCVLAFAVTDRDACSDVTALSGVCLAAAALTKNEGLAAVALVALIAAVRFRRTWRRRLPILLAPLPGLAWLGVTRIVGARSLAVDDSRYGELLRLDPAVRERIVPTVEALWEESWVLIVVAGAVTVAGLLAIRPSRWAVWLWAAWLATELSVALAYVASPLDLQGHLVSSVARTSFAGNFLLVAVLALWMGHGRAHTRSRSSVVP
jgi:hypothetical protein